MARPAGQRIEEIDAERAADVPRHLWREAIKQVGKELIRELKDQCSTPNPPPFKNSSKDGEYPRARTFEFVDGLTLTYSEDDMALRLYSKTHDRHGVFLQNGLRDGTTRPFGTKILAEQDWVARIARVARAMTK